MGLKLNLGPIFFLFPSPHALLSSSHYCSPLCVATSLFALLFSSSCHIVVLLFTLLFYFSHYCSPFYITLLLSSSCCLGSIFALLLSSSVILLFQVQGFSRCYSHLRATIIGVLLFVEESYATPLHSFLQELGMVGSQESEICKYFSFCSFPFLFF